MARVVAESLGIKTQKLPRHLTVVGEEVPARLTALQRDVLYSRIRDLGNLYSLNWLIRQETEHVSFVIECLTDEQLQSLMQTMQRGAECRVEGIAFDDAGLVRHGWEAT